MSTTVSFSKYVSTEGKAERLSEYVGHEVTLSESGGYAVSGTLVKVFDDPDEGWLATVWHADRDPWSWTYLSDVSGFTVDGE